MRRISLSRASTSPEPEAAQIQSENMHDGSSGRKAHSELLLPKPAIRVSSSLNAVTLMQQKAADDASEVFRIAQPDESAADDADCAPMDKDGGAASDMALAQKSADSSCSEPEPEPEPEPETR
ncbi:hypothetical protein LPJ56_005793, partial [Coemansia sp. RSA 2599]